jgi:hypothetical protein
MRDPRGGVDLRLVEGLVLEQLLANGIEPGSAAWTSLHIDGVPPVGRWL